MRGEGGGNLTNYRSYMLVEYHTFGGAIMNYINQN